MTNLDINVDLDDLTAQMESIAHGKTDQTTKSEKTQEISTIRNEGYEIHEKNETNADEGYILSPLEELAKSHGWKPEGEKDAKEFIEFALDNFSPRGKEIKDLKATVEAMKEHMDKQRQAGYQQALYDLQKARQDAILDGNVAQVDALDEQINAYEYELAKEQPQETFSPEALSFAERHASWINDRESLIAYEMREFVKQRDNALAALNLPHEQHIAILERNLQEKFPSYFNKGEETQKHAYVDRDTTSGTVRHTRRGKVGFEDLNPAQKVAARQFEKRGIMSVNKYIEQLKELGEL